ncbi:MAG: hypothetical protein KAQ87_02075 [Candidatus Pacebacteria bacterium]|nr:hypothetical protein [Candidatus Paceibacterota bacterium]
MKLNFDTMNNTNEQQPDLNPDEIIEEDLEQEPSISQIKEKIKDGKELNNEEEKVLMKELEIIMEVVRKQEEGEILTKEEEKINNEGGEIISLVAEAIDKGFISVGREMNGVVDNMDEIKDFKKLSEEEKTERIEERKGKIENAAKEMGIKLKDDIGEIEKQIEDFREELKDKYEEYAEIENNLNQIHGANVEEGEGIRKMKETFSSLKGIYKGQLHIAYLEYWKKYKQDPKLLFESHAERELLMSKWEALIGNLEIAGDAEEEVLRAWAQWVKDHPGITLAALALALAAGITAGVLLYPEVMAFLAERGGEEIIKEVGPEVAKTSIWVAGKAFAVSAAGVAAGTAVGAGFLGKVISLLSDEEKRDSLAEWLCGAKLSGVAYWANGRPGAKKTA